MSLEELRAGWAAWSSADRIDFCTNARWLRNQSDFTDMLRFIAAEAKPMATSSIALSIATSLPRDEAFGILVGLLDSASPSSSANVLQAIARTGHPSAVEVIAGRLRTLQADPDILVDDPFMNWIAFAAICAVKYLLELGAPPSEFESTVRTLSQHPCAEVRDTCSRYVGTKYPWLPAPADLDLG